MSDLKSIIVATQDKFRLNPQEALATFHSHSELQEGLRSQVSLRQHVITVDEPESLGGTDQGANPAELILAALGSCQEITYRAYATALGIPLTSVRVELEGTIDLRGFFGVDDRVRAGYQGIRGKVYLESSAPPETLEQLRFAVNEHCPVLDILKEPVAVDLELEVASVAQAV